METHYRSFDNWKIPDNDMNSDSPDNRVFLAFDTEYHSGTRNSLDIGGKMIEVNQRRLQDVDSIQFAINYRNIQPRLVFIHRDTEEPVFCFYDMFREVKRYLIDIGVFTTLQGKKCPIYFELWTLWGGVDVSVFSDYEKVLLEGNPHGKKGKNGKQQEVPTEKLVTIHGNTIFTSKPLRIMIQDHYRHSIGWFAKPRLVIRDMTKLAPGKMSLKTLGKMVGQQKLDTTKWDKADGYSNNFYKKHMSILWQNRPSDFVSYAMEDVAITALYGDFILEFQHQLTIDGFGDFKPLKLKASLGSIDASIIACRNQEPAQWIISEVNRRVNRLLEEGSPGDMSSFLKPICKYQLRRHGKKIKRDYDFKSLNRSNIVSWLNTHLDFDVIRKGYRFPDLRMKSIPHHNSSVHDITNRIDLPLNDYFDIAVKSFAGGYNVTLITGILPSGGEKRCIDLAACYSESGHLIPDIAPGLGEIKTFKNVSSPDFSNIVNFANHVNGPYSVGVGTFDIIYPPTYHGFCLTPKNVNDGPRYFTHIEQVTLTYTDAFTAWKCGAQVYTHKLTFIQQSVIKQGSLNGVCMEGKIQDIFQKRREKCAHHSPEDLMNKNVVNQCYGITAEGLKMKKSRNLGDNKSYYVPFSRVTNPLKAVQFTAIARLHIIYLQNAIRKVDHNALLCNNVTDGCLIWVKKPLTWEKLNGAMDKATNSWHRTMIHSFFDGKYLKLKEVSTDDVANLRTRLSFCRDCTDPNNSKDNGIKAMVGIQDISPAQLFHDYLDSGKPLINQREHMITGLVDMRFVEKFQHVQSAWNTTSDLYLAYDFAQWPTEYHCCGNFVYWDTRTYHSEDEFLSLWSRGRDLMRYGTWYLADFAPFYYQTLVGLEKGFKPCRWYRADPKANNGFSYDGTEAYQNWLLYTSVMKLDSKEAYEYIAAAFKTHGWNYIRGKVIREMPKYQSFLSKLRRINQRHYKLVPNYVLLHELNLI